MAISLLGSVVNNVATSSASASVTHSLSTGSNRIIFAFIGSLQSTYRGYVTGVTYGGTAMQSIEANGTLSGSYIFGEIYYLLESGLTGKTGNQTVTATYSGTCDTIRIAVVSVAGARQSAPTTRKSYANVGTASMPVDISTLEDNSWIIGGAWSNSASTFTYDGTGQTELLDINGSNLATCVSYQPISVAGISGTSFTASISAKCTWGAVSISQYTPP